MVLTLIFRSFSFSAAEASSSFFCFSSSAGTHQHTGLAKRYLDSAHLFAPKDRSHPPWPICLVRIKRIGVAGLAQGHAFFLGPICFWTSLIWALSWVAA